MLSNKYFRRSNRRAALVTKNKNYAENSPAGDKKGTTTDEKKRVTVKRRINLKLFMYKVSLSNVILKTHSYVNSSILHFPC